MRTKVKHRSFRHILFVDTLEVKFPLYLLLFVQSPVTMRLRSGADLGTSSSDDTEQSNMGSKRRAARKKSPKSVANGVANSHSTTTQSATQQSERVTHENAKDGPNNSPENSTSSAHKQKDHMRYIWGPQTPFSWNVNGLILINCETWIA